MIWSDLATFNLEFVRRLRSGPIGSADDIEAAVALVTGAQAPIYEFGIERTGPISRFRLVRADSA